MHALVNNNLLNIALYPLYCPPVAWLRLAINAEKIHIPTDVLFQKQTLMSRCHIKGANKTETLTVPIIRTARGKPISEAEIAYSQNWYQQHKHAMQTAYGKSAYFEYFADDLFHILTQRHEKLLSLNLTIIEYIFNILSFKGQIALTTSKEIENITFIPYFQETDAIHREPLKPYFQFFGDFVPNLSILDLIFHHGKDAFRYLV
jgi:hypothetical protein